MLGTLIQALFDPNAAAVVASVLVGRPDIADDLQAICFRESRCSLVEAHDIDAHLSPRGWRSQVRLGHLDPECQPYKAGAWATRGPWGLSAASHWPYLPDCYQPHWLDVPLVSAVVAARKYLARCEQADDLPWCHVPRRVRVRNARRLRGAT